MLDARVGVDGSSGGSAERRMGDPCLVCLRGLGLGVASVTTMLAEGSLKSVSIAVWEAERVWAFRFRLIEPLGTSASKDGVNGS